MAPPAGSDCSRSARVATSCIAASSVNAPTTQAAMNSPSEWPATAVGVTPHARSVVANAYSSAKSAGCVQRVSSRSVGGTSLRPNITSSNFRSRIGSITAAQESIAARNTGSVSYRSRPMPTHCAPCPVKSHACRGARPASTRPLFAIVAAPSRKRVSSAAASAPLAAATANRSANRARPTACV